MNISKQGLQFIKQQEGCFLFVYDDKVYPTKEYKGGPVKGTLTIGIGHTDAALHPLKIKKGLRITETEALDILNVDLSETVQQVNDAVKVKLSQGQFDALVSFTYNCGAGNLKKLIVPLNKRDYDGTRAKFGLYIRSKGEVMRGLVNRRAGEQALWDARIEDAKKVPTNSSLPSEVDEAPQPKQSWWDTLVKKGSVLLPGFLTASVDYKTAAVLVSAGLVLVAGIVWYERKQH